METLIYENDEQVGCVDLDTEASTYDGANADVERVLRKMETEGYTHRVPLPRYIDEQGRRVKGAKREKRTGDGLGRYLLRVLEEKGRDDEVRTEAVGFDPDYEFIEIGEHPESG